MTAQNNLEIKGNLLSHPFAELLLESSEAGLTGSFRLSSETNKVIVYLNNGKVVFAVSNARRHRLFETLLREKVVSQTQLTGIPNLANDLELGANLKTKNILSESKINEMFSVQIAEILQSVFKWTEGGWIFSPQNRIREIIRFETNLPPLLLNYGRGLSDETVTERLKDSRQTFGAKPFFSTNVELHPTEAFVLSRFEKSFLPAHELQILSSLPDSAVAKILYTLWLGGFLFRQNWQAAFSKRKISEILSAKLSLKKEINETPEELAAPKPVVSVAPISILNETIVKPIIEEKPVQKEFSLEEYLDQVENAPSHYEVLNVTRDADLKEIKPRYFSLAKQFHPDMFHQEKDSMLLQRIQAAFAKIAQAYETLKDAEARKVYDYKLDKNLIVQKPKNAGDSSPMFAAEQQKIFAKECFEQGFSLLMEDEYEEATTLLARAAQAMPNNAKYRAYYGKALSADETQRYKADTELQTAIKLEPQNIDFRLMSAEFYIQYELFKRAEGELKRLLSISPNHPEALRLLENLSSK